MSFNVLFMAHAPGADPHQHQSEIDAGQFKLFSVVVRDQAQALSVAKEMADAHQLDSVLLCPGFTHGNAAEIFQSLDGEVAVAVARGDGPSSRISTQAMQRAYQG